jgi:hypothetical protein
MRPGTAMHGDGTIATKDVHETYVANRIYCQEAISIRVGLRSQAPRSVRRGSIQFSPGGFIRNKVVHDSISVRRILARTRLIESRSVLHRTLVPESKCTCNYGLAKVFPDAAVPQTGRLPSSIRRGCTFWRSRRCGGSRPRLLPPAPPSTTRKSTRIKTKSSGITCENFRKSARVKR